ncbi:MAG: PD40 domain-containing protein [Bacteroidetes bacterium]|nr:PD40 domain-containing protein [Bacteroidota bacterium]
MRKYQKYFLLFIVPLAFIYSSCNKNEDIVSVIPEIEYENHDDYAMWTSDGSKMIYYGYENDSTKGTYLLDMTGLQGINKRKISDNYFIQLTSDGNSAYYYSYYSGIFKRRLEGDTSAVLISTVRTVQSISNDGQWLAYQSGENSPSSLGFVWKIRIDGTHKKRLVYAPTEGEIRDPTWFPDGIRLSVLRYFVSDEFDAPQIAIIDTNGNSTTLTHDNQWKHSPKVSPDGNYVTYYTFKNNGTVCVVKTDGSEVRELTAGFSVNPGWSSDSKFVTYTNVIKGDGRIWAVPVTGGLQTKITE